MVLILAHLNGPLDALHVVARKLLEICHFEADSEYNLV